MNKTAHGGIAPDFNRCHRAVLSHEGSGALEPEPAKVAHIPVCTAAQQILDCAILSSSELSTFSFFHVRLLADRPLPLVHRAAKSCRFPLSLNSAASPFSHLRVLERRIAASLLYSLLHDILLAAQPHQGYTTSADLRLSDGLCPQGEDMGGQDLLQCIQVQLEIGGLKGEHLERSHWQFAPKTQGNQRVP